MAEALEERTYQAEVEVAVLEVKARMDQDKDCQELAQEEEAVARELLVSDSEMVLETVEWVRVAGQEQVQVKAVLARVDLVLADTALMPLEATPV